MTVAASTNNSQAEPGGKTDVVSQTEMPLEHEPLCCEVAPALFFLGIFVAGALCSGAALFRTLTTILSLAIACWSQLMAATYPKVSEKSLWQIWCVLPQKTLAAGYLLWGPPHSVVALSVGGLSVTHIFCFTDCA